MRNFLLASLCWLGTLSLSHADLVLYSSNRCPYCKNVDDYLNSVHKTTQIKIIDDDQSLKEELKEKGGKVQVPCLIVDTFPLYGSKDIIQWIKTHPERLQDES